MSAIQAEDVSLISKQQMPESQHIGMGWKRLILLTTSAGTSRADVRRARLRSLARRTLIGSLVTMSASVANFSVVMVRNGVAAWLCVLSCKLDGELCVLSLYC